MLTTALSVTVLAHHLFTSLPLLSLVIFLTPARIIDTFLQWVRDGSASTPVEGASPLDARASVAAGFAATQSLRNNGHPVDIPPLPAEVAAYFS